MTLPYTQRQHIPHQRQWLSLLNLLQDQDSLYNIDKLITFADSLPDYIKVINLVPSDSPFINSIDYLPIDALLMPPTGLRLAKTLRVTSTSIKDILATPNNNSLHHINTVEYICTDDGTALIQLMTSQRLGQLKGLKLVDLDEDVLINLVDASLWNSVSHLELQDASFDEESIDYLEARQHPLHSLMSLKVSQIEPMGRFLEAFLVNTPYLNLLDVNQDAFDTGDFKCLTLCSQARLLNHLSWRVSPHHAILEQDIETLSQALMSLNLHSLSLIGILASQDPQLCQSTLTSLTQSPFNDHLQFLSLASNGLGDSEIPSGGMLKHFSNLTHVDISDNRFGPKVIADLCATQLTLQGLKLSHSHLGSDGARALATYGGLKGLLELDLKCTSLGDEDVYCIFSSNDHFKLQYLDLTGNHLTVALNPFWQEKRNLEHLKVIDLGNNQLDATSINAILLSPSLSNVRTISLDFNNLDENEGRQLLQIPELGKLVKLSLSGNSISQQTLRMIHDIINKDQLLIT